MNPRRQPLDWILECLSLLSLIGIAWMLISSWPQIPARVPLHFNAAGKPNGYGDKSGLFILPVTSLFIYLVATAAASRQEFINIPMSVNRSEPAVRALLARMTHVLKAIVLLTFFFLARATFQTALGRASGLGVGFLPGTLLALLAATGYFLHRLRPYRN